MTAFKALITILCATQWGIDLNTLISTTTHIANAQMIWTPIYVGGTSQVDLWTQSTGGCSCSFNTTRTDCACCVQSGGCSCGYSSPHRCTQCGLEQNCANMCNMTLDSKKLLNKSGRGFGQIKSPSLTGPTRCTYRFVPDTGQRVELQIYRVVDIGHHNGSMCEGGWLQLGSGVKVCGRNERYDPPVVLFSDSDVTTLHMQINEKTSRSQFFAYFSFTSTTSTSVGWPARGGKRENNTGCDWVYEDTNCQKGCIIASPGYPGVYAPNSRCRYLITSGPRVSVTVSFTAVLMPHNHCASDYIALYSGTTTSSPLLSMLCGNKKTSLVHTGQNLLVEFRSGPGVPPFDYNGFVATLNFAEITTEAPTTVATESASKASEMVKSAVNQNQKYSDGRGDADSHQENHIRRQNLNSCDIEVRGEEAHRAGNYDTRGKPKTTNCRLILRGGSYDTVHVAFASYNLSAPACGSMIEVFDGPLDGGTTDNGKSLKRICSPAQRLPQETSPIEKYVEPERYSSTGRDMTVVLRRSSSTPRDEEYMDAVYYFHDEREGGTQQPASVCDVEYFGLSSRKNGSVVHPAPHRLFSLERPLKCRQNFIPAANQSVIITLQSTNRQRLDGPCHTECGDSGCRCFSNKSSLDDIDHIQLVSETGHIVSCLCGNYQDWLPVGVRSWTPVSIEWSRSSRSGLDFKASYKFTEDSYCGDHSTTRSEGEVNSGDLANEVFKLNKFYQQRCTWVLDSSTDRQLTVEVESNQSKPCTAWNLTIHEYSNNGDPAGPRLHTFCSRDRHKNFTLPWKMNTVVVRLQALSRTAPQYVMKWRSNLVTLNNRKSGASPAPNQVAGSLGNRAMYNCWTISNAFMVFIGYKIFAPLLAI